MASIIACGTVDGDRAQNGSCPEGERCSDDTPEGLTFIGTGFWDDAAMRLGPVVVGGRLDIGLMQPDGSSVPPFVVEIEDGDVLSVARGTGAFNPGQMTGVEVDEHVVVRGLSEGTTTIRIVDPDDGTLFDRITVPIYEISGVTMVNLSDPDRDWLEAGTEEVLGVRLVVGDTEATTRAIDQDVDLTATGVIQPELMYWDCFSYEVPEDSEQITFEITAGDLVSQVTLDVL